VSERLTGLSVISLLMMDVTLSVTGFLDCVHYLIFLEQNIAEIGSAHILR
jgi:hypothetical protein